MPSDEPTTTAAIKARARDLADDVKWYQGELDTVRRENDRLWAALVILTVAMFVIGYLVGALTS